MPDDDDDPFLMGPALPSPPPPARRRGFPWRTANLVAAGLVLFLAGAAAQTFRQPRAQLLDERAQRFALLLYDRPKGPDGEPLDDVAEIREWVRGLRRNGHYVAGEMLALGSLEVERDTTWIAWPDMSHGTMLGALFVVSAADAQEIVTIAQSSPHVQNGGRIIVRPIERI